MPQDKPQIDLSILQQPERPAIDLSPLEEGADTRPPIDMTPMEHEGSIAQNVAGGALVGAVNDTFTASMGTIFTAQDKVADQNMLDNMVVISTPEGNLLPPWEWTIKSPSEYLGISDEKWDTLQPSQRRVLLSEKTKQEGLKITGADENSAGYFIGNMAGMILGDPISYTPLVTAQTGKVRALQGGTIGAIDMATYDIAHQGDTTPGSMILGAGFGAVLGAATKARPKLYPGNADVKIRDAARDTLSKLNENAITISNKEGIDPVKAYLRATTNAQLDSKALETLMRDAGHADIKYLTKSRNLDSEFRRIADKVLEPVSVRIKELSPKLHMNLTRMFRKSAEHNFELEQMANRFVDPRINKIAGDDAIAMKKMMLVGDEGAFKDFLTRMPKAVETNYKAYKAAMDELYGMLSAVRKDVNGLGLGPKKELYMHRAVKDVGAFKNWMQKTWDKENLDRVESIIAKRYGKDATDAQIAKIYNEYLNGFHDLKGTKKTPKGSQARKLHKKDFDEHPELIDAFHDPLQATHSYIKETVEDFYRKQLFGPKLVAIHGDVIDDALFDGFIGNIAQKEGLTTGEITELKTLLNSIFINGVKAPHKAIRDFKQLTYAGLLGNPLSAVTQFGDLLMAAAKFGPTAAVDGVLRSMGKGRLSPTRMGLMESMMEELVGTGWSHNILIHALKGSGFKTVDNLGKAATLNAALSKAQKQIKSVKGVTSLHAKWGRAFGDDFPQLLKDLQEGKITSLTKDLAFAELADLQPITLMEMPQMYLNHPDGRLMYMLKTFQLKYFNLLRQNFYYAAKEGDLRNAIPAAAALGAAYVVGGASTDMIKQTMLSRDYNIDQIITDNTLRAVSGPLMLDRYSGEKLIKSRDPLTDIVKNLAPPIGFYSPQLHTIAKVAQGEMRDVGMEAWVKQIPIFGKLIENYLLGGAEEHNFKKWKRGE